MFNLETLSPEGSSAQALSLAEHGMRALSERAGAPTAARQRRIAEAARLFQTARRHPLGDRILMEAFSTSDYPLTFGWFTDRQMLARYETTPAAWQAFLKRSTLPDFRAAARDRMQGLDTPMPLLAMGEPYKNDARLSGSRDTSLQVKKFGRAFPLQWESQVNDVLEQLADLPSAFARAARNTEQYQACAAYAANATIYGNHTVNGVVFSNKGTGVLSIANLKTAITSMRRLRDDNGNPIYLGAKLTLVVPPDLEMEAKQILGAQNFIFDTNPTAGTQKQRMQTENYIAPMCSLAVDYWLPILDPTNGATSWYLFADPGSLPAGEVVFLRGQETPALFMRSPNAVRISENSALGGDADPMSGSFENDEVAYKVRHCVGAGLYEWRATYWSNGTTEAAPGSFPPPLTAGRAGAAPPASRAARSRGLPRGSDLLV
jgi:hypothetical protein